MNLSNEIKNFIKDHARESLPNECGGLILKDEAGNLTVCRCANASETPEKSCVIKRDEVQEKSVGYTIEAIYHSHPSDFKDFSWEDKFTSEESKLNLVLFCAKSNTFETYEPKGFVAPLTGRNWSMGIFSCASIIKDYYEKVLGIEIKEDNLLELCGRNLKDFDVVAAYLRSDVDEEVQRMMAEIVSRTDEKRPWQAMLIKNNFIRVKDLRKHDVLLMKFSLENLNKKYNITYPIHASIYLGDGRLLHQTSGEKSGVKAFGEKQKLAVTHIFRHKELLNEN